MENCNTLNNRPQRNLWIDIFRILLSLLVVGLHTVGTGTPLTQVYRFAVPAFFIISGFYAYCSDENKSVEKSKRFVKSTLQYFAIGFVIYAILIIIRTAVVGDNVRDFLVKFIREIEYNRTLVNFFITNVAMGRFDGYLWFLRALITISVIHYFLVKYKKTKWYVVIVPLALVIYFVVGNYLKLFTDFELPNRYTRNAIFFGLPLFGLGYLLAQLKVNEKHWHKWVYLAVGLAFCFVQIAESLLVVAECYISSIISAVCLLKFFASLKSPKADWFYKYVGKNVFFYIYVIHLPLIYMFNEILSSTVALWFVVFFASLALYFVGFYIAMAVKVLAKKHSESKVAKESTETQE